MAVILLTESNLIFIKRELRNRYTSTKSSHISEALAYSFGRRTHAALLAEMNAQISSGLHLVCFSKKRFFERLVQLDNSLAAIEIPCKLESYQFPNPIWREFKDGDIQNLNTWFYQCQQQGIPYVYITRRRKYVQVGWDCITLDSGYDKAIHEDGRRLLDTMFERFQSLAKPWNAFFEGSAFVGDINTLIPEAAYKIADEIFTLLYSTIWNYRQGVALHELQFLSHP